MYDSELYNSAIHDIIIKVNHGHATMYAGLNDDEKAAAKACAHEMYCATMFIMQADKFWYEKLQENLENTFTWGNQDYPKDMA